MAIRSIQMHPHQKWPSLREAARVAPRLGRDFGIVVGVIFVYFLARAQAPASESVAVNVTDWIVSFERGLNVFWEPAIQAWSIKYYALQETANFTYAYLHFPVLAAVAVWLWFRDRRQFVFVRNVMFISMVFGLVFYYLVPAAPPRLLAMHGEDLGFRDTVFGGNTSVSYAQPSLILNEYAAIPSFHFGWIALASAAIWINTRNPFARVLAIALSVLMTWAIVASANHFFFDMALGGLVVAVSWKLARRMERRPESRELALTAEAEA